MAKICYTPQKFEKRTRSIIDRANQLLETYAADGMQITLRSLYYRFVAAGWMPNKQTEYKRLGDILGRARLAGLVDWNHLCDRTRNLSLLNHYHSPQEALKRLANSYHTDLWATQKYRPEVWIEKDALVGVIERVCDENDVPYFSCRGYTSLSEMWAGAMRLRRWSQNGQRPYIIHFGDHDPSGMDMSRDIMDRIQTTFMVDIEFKRVALNMAQIEEHEPPPNPAKQTDSRYAQYSEDFGEESWELDALPPVTFREIIEAELKRIRDPKAWKKALADKESARSRLVEVQEDWEQIPRLKEQHKELTEKVKELSAYIARVVKNPKKPAVGPKPKKKPNA